MSNRRVAASLPVLFATLLLIQSALAQGHSNGQYGRAPSANSPFAGDGFDNPSNMGRIHGTVHTFDGHPVSNATVAAHDVAHGTVSVSVRTEPNGTFVFPGLPPGSYEVTASVGADQTSERADIKDVGDTSIDFRLPNKVAGARASANGSSVSFAQYQVPAKARSLFEKASELMERGKIAQALEKVNAALTNFPKFAEALTLRGVLEERMDKMEAAIEDYGLAIQADPHFPLAYVTMASVLNSAGRFNEALPFLTEVERFAPNLWQASYESARCSLGRNDFEGALRSVDRAAQLRGSAKGDRPELHLVRGYALLGLSENSKASAEIQTFLASHPTGHNAEMAKTVLSKLQESTVATSR
jgi:Flp pilus assembly protein TadD